MTIAYQTLHEFIFLFNFQVSLQHIDSKYLVMSMHHPSLQQYLHPRENRPCL